MERRAFVKTAAASGVIAALRGSAPAAQSAIAATSGRDKWIGTLRRLADPVLSSLANGTLKSRMPVEEAAGANRRPVTHLEALVVTGRDGRFEPAVTLG